MKPEGDREAVVADKPATPPARRALLVEIGAFLVSGGIAAVVNLGAGAGFRVLFGVQHNMVSVAVGFALGTVVSFVLNREFTFRARRDSVQSQMIRFGLTAVAGIAVAAGIAQLAFLAGRALAGTWLAAHFNSSGRPASTNRTTGLPVARYSPSLVGKLYVACRLAGRASASTVA